ncbi:MAG: hypothetical protein PHN20_05155, partial [Bacteroidales bacterium]|nr:hypothetical protein [Bacteroidales bacterium]
ICFFVSNAQSAFYQSEVFGKILDYAGKHLANTRLREANGKRSLLIENIENIHTALVQLELMQ